MFKYRHRLKKKGAAKEVRFHLNVSQRDTISIRTGKTIRQNIDTKENTSCWSAFALLAMFRFWLSLSRLDVLGINALSETYMLTCLKVQIQTPACFMVLWPTR